MQCGLDIYVLPIYSNNLYTFHIHKISVVPGRKAKRKIEEIETVASQSGTGAHVFVPKEWLGKTVRVTLVD